MSFLDELFGGGSRTITTVGTQVSRVIPDNLLPNSQKSGVFNAVLSRDQSSSMSDHILEEMATSVSVKAEQMYRYGKSQYSYGLPSGQYVSHSQGRSQVQSILNALHSQVVRIEYCNYGPLNYLHIGWIYLGQNHGWNSVTNELTALSAVKGVPVYLDNLEVVVPTSQAPTFSDAVLAQWGPPGTAGGTPIRPVASPEAGALRSASHIRLEADATHGYVLATAIWRINGAIRYEQFAVTPPSMATGGGYFHVRYTVNGIPYYWIYRGGNGDYPALDVLYTLPLSLNGTYFPFVYLRFNSQNSASNQTTQEFRTSKRLAKYLGMDYVAVCDAVNSNPDIADVRQAMVMFAVPVNTSNQLELRYLYDYFDTLYQSQNTHYQLSSQAGTASYFANDPNLNTRTMVIQDNRFRMLLSHSGLVKRRLGGTIGAVGTHSMHVTSTSVTSTYVDFTEGFNSPVTTTTVTKHHHYRRQVTAGLYEEIKVSKLEMTYYINNEYPNTADDTETFLLIPLDQSITRDYPLAEREILYTRSLHYVFNSVSFQTQHTAWYQTSLFQGLVTLAAVVIAVNTGQFQLVGAALAGDVVAAIAVLKSIVIMAAVQQGLRLFVKEVGGEAAMVLAVIAAAVAVSKGYSAGSIQGAPWAKELLYVANGLSKETAAYYAQEISDLMEDYSQMLEYQKELDAELNAAQKMLEGENIMSPFVIFGEKPEEYFNRTVHSGNVGISGIKAISDYVDNALKLPELHETIDL